MKPPSLPSIAELRARWRTGWSVWLLAVLGGSLLAGGLLTARIARLDSSLLPEPLRMYARPVAFRVGVPMDPSALEADLKRLGYERTAGRSVEPGRYRLGRRTWRIGRRPFRVGGKLYAGGLLTARVDRRGRILELTDGAGRSLEAATLEPELLATAYGPRAEARLAVPLADVPPHVVNAVLAVEDRRFFRHGGLDLKRILGALVANLERGRVVQGGSTLTQQLAKNLYLSPRRTLLRKLSEAWLALALEARYTKEEILQAYLNEVYLGQDGEAGVHGVGQGALHFFGKDVTELGVAEGALLAGLIRGPSLYSPRRHPEAARRRRDFVLGLMRDRGLLEREEAERALASPLGVRVRRRPDSGARYFADYLTRALPPELRPGSKAARGVALFTTLDARLQRAAEEAVNRRLRRLEREHRWLRGGPEPLQAALVALDPHTGEILAMVGGREYGASQFNRAVDARRQPGSLFKPVVALAALSRNQGRDPPFTLASRLDDEELAVRTPAGVWRPVNYDRRFRGRVSLREALQSSLNVPFARLGLAVGPERIVETAARLGITSRLAPYPSLALGASEVTLLEMTRAYGVFAAQGRRARTRSILATVGPEGGRTWRVDPDPRIGGDRAFDPAETFLVTSALRGVVEWGTGRRLARLGVTGAVAGKTGSTNGFRDAWFVGYTPELAVGVWVGFDDGRGLRVPGAAAALPIFADFLEAAAGPHVPGAFRAPAGVELAEVDPETGLRAGPGCRGQLELFLAGTAPRESCSPWRIVGNLAELDRWWRDLAGRAEMTTRQMERELRRRLKALQREARRRGETRSGRDERRSAPRRR
ncbi:MAG: transglycosylase domain-containing protein [Gemmatimonadota bacterium]